MNCAELYSRPPLQPNYPESDRLLRHLEFGTVGETGWHAVRHNDGR